MMWSYRWLSPTCCLPNVWGVFLGFIQIINLHQQIINNKSVIKINKIMFYPLPICFGFFLTSSSCRKPAFYIKSPKRSCFPVAPNLEEPNCWHPDSKYFDWKHCYSHVLQIIYLLTTQWRLSDMATTSSNDSIVCLVYLARVRNFSLSYNKIFNWVDKYVNIKFEQISTRLFIYYL